MLSVNRILRLRAGESLKLILAVIFGIVTKTVYDLSWRYECHKCKVLCARGENEADDVIHPFDQPQLREQYKPSRVSDNIRYQYFNNKYVYDTSDRGQPRYQLRGFERMEIRDVVTQAVMLVKTASHPSGKWQFQNLRNGFKRLDPLRGQEFILDLNGQDQNLPVSYRIQLVKPFTSAHLVHLHTQTAQRPPAIHFVLPLLYNSSVVQLERFLASYEDCCLQKRESVTLFVVLYTGEGMDTHAQAKDLQNIIMNLKSRFINARIRFINTHKDSSHSALLDLGCRQISNDVLIALIDVNVVIGTGFLDRCRYNVQAGRRVYYPIPFSQYETATVRTSNARIPVLNIDENMGFWAYDNYYTICLYNQDYKLASGFNSTIRQWEQEAYDLYSRQLKIGLEVFRSPEPGLIRPYTAMNGYRRVSAYGPSGPLTVAAQCSPASSRKLLKKDADFNWHSGL